MKKLWPLLKPYLILIPISVLYAIAFNWCFKPNAIAYGGATGIAQMINHWLDIEVGTLIIIINIPIFIIGWKHLSKKMAILSLYATVLTSLMIDVVGAFWTFEPMDSFLACIFGGALLGLSIGGIALQEASTGGTDLAARLIKLWVSWLPVGRVMLVLDLSVIALVAVVFGQISSALYGMIALYISSMVVDTVLYGLDKSQLAYIISDKHKEVSDAITRDLNRGVTLLEGQGGWSGNDKKVILCAFKQRQIVRVKILVKQIDPNAFIIVCPAYEVMGMGFRRDDSIGY